MPEPENNIIIIGDQAPGLFLAAAIATAGKPVSIFRKSKNLTSKLRAFWQEQLTTSQIDLISEANIEAFNKVDISGSELIIDNYSWQQDQWWQEISDKIDKSAAGWVSLVPVTINQFQSRHNFCGLIFFPDFKYYPFAEIIAGESNPAVEKLKSVLSLLHCYQLSTKGENKFLSLAVGLHFHYLALNLNQIIKTNIQDIEHWLGNAAGFLPLGILSSLHKNPYLKILHQHKNQLQELLSLYPYVANLKDDHLLRHLPKPGKVKKLPELQHIKTEPDIDERIRKLLLLDNEKSLFYQNFFWPVFQWASYMVTDYPVRADQLDAIYKYAWNWPRGPFEFWNKWEPNQVLQDMEQLQISPAGWVYRINQSVRHFYRWEASGKKILDTEKWYYVPAEIPEHLSDFKPDRILWHKPEATITEVDENLINLEFHSKLNMMDQDALQGIDEALKIVDSEDYKGIVISNHGAHFTVGVNLGLVFISAIEKDYEYIQYMIEAFQQLMMKLKYARVPVVMACQGYTIGGGTEMLLHLQNKVVAHHYARVGLVETNAGLIPGGGGSKEMSIRAEKALKEENWAEFILKFENIASGRINQDAEQAKKHRLLPADIPVPRNRDWLLHQAKQLLLQFQPEYSVPGQRQINVAGRSGIDHLENYIEENKKPMKWSKRKVKLLKKAAYVFCGGNIAQNTMVSEQELLDLEKEYFLKLCGERYTLQRMNKILQGKK
ncbi:MAG: enoyl-CoA hydratase/isomerase family protein [Cyclobacteriaceae bacterium]